MKIFGSNNQNLERLNIKLANEGELIINKQQLIMIYSRRGNCSKSFLTSSVPNLQFYPFAVHLHCADLEVHADGCYVAAGESVVSKPYQQRALPYICNKFKLYHTEKYVK